MSLTLSLLYRIAVTVNHSSMFVASNQQKTFQHIATQGHGLSLQTQQCITAYRQLGNLHDKLAATQVVSHHKGTVLRSLSLVCLFFTYQQKNMPDGVAAP